MVGRLLATKLSWAYIDLDQWIEGRWGETISQMVKKGGWELFRERERQALAQALRGDDKSFVVACGGGAVLHKDLWTKIRADSLVIWLKASVDTIIKRMGHDPTTVSSRPSLKTGMSLKEEVLETLSERQPLYKAFCHDVIETDQLSPEEVADRIMKVIKEEAGAR